MAKPQPTRYRTTNWSSYNAAPLDGRLGRPPVFSDAAIQYYLTITVPFKLPMRQTAGMVVSLLRLAGLNWPVPDFSTLCRR